MQAVGFSAVEPCGPEASFRFGGHLAEDAAGRLYDLRAREQLRRWPMVDTDRRLAAAEAIRAAAAAARIVRYVSGRSAQASGLSDVRFRLLLLLRHHPLGQLALSQLADQLDLSPRTVTSLVDLLERDQLVTRVPHATDRRSTLVRLTQAGCIKVDEVGREVFQRHSAGFDGFSVEEMEQLRHLAYKLMISLSSGLD